MQELIGFIFIGLAAQGQPAEGSTPLDPVLACRTEASDEARLRCYDAAVGALQQSVAEGKVLAIDPRRERRSMFGRSAPDFLGDSDGETEDVDFIESKIKSSGHSGFQRWIITLEDGSVWRTTDPSGERPPPRAGTEVRIDRNAVGSHSMSVGRTGQYRVTRVR